jgi:hypothetical protein
MADLTVYFTRLMIFYWINVLWYSFYVCLLFCIFILYFIYYVFLCRFRYCFSFFCCLFPVFVQVYRPLPSGGNPIAVNKISCHVMSWRWTVTGQNYLPWKHNIVVCDGTVNKYGYYCEHISEIEQCWVSRLIHVSCFVWGWIQSEVCLRRIARSHFGCCCPHTGR